MRKHLISLIGIIILLVAAVSNAQPTQTITTSSTTCPGAGCAILSTSGQGTIAIQITGSWSGTLTFYGSVDGTNYVTLNVTPPNSTTAVTTTTANGIWGTSVAGIQFVKVLVTSAGTGTATITSRTTLSARGSAGGSGGGGGIGGSTGSTDNALLRADGTGGSTLQNSLATVSDLGQLALQAVLTNSPDSSVAIYNGSANGNLTDIVLHTSGDTGQSINCYVSGGTLSAPTNSWSGDNCLISYVGYVNGAFRTVANIGLQDQGTPSTNTANGRIVFNMRSGTDLGTSKSIIFDKDGGITAASGFVSSLTSSNVIGTWTVGAGWTQSPVGTFTHTNGTAAVTNSYIFVVGNVYSISYTISSTTGTVAITAGGAYSDDGSFGAGTFVATGTGVLTFTPSNTYDGVVSDVVITLDSSMLSDTNSDICGRIGSVYLCSTDSKAKLFNGNPAQQEVVISSMDLFDPSFAGSAIDLGPSGSITISGKVILQNYGGGQDAATITFPEVTAPSAPDANRGVIFVQDSGGKSQACFRFPSGSSQCFATEP